MLEKEKIKEREKNEIYDVLHHKYNEPTQIHENSESTVDSLNFFSRKIKMTKSLSKFLKRPKVFQKICF